VQPVQQLPATGIGQGAKDGVIIHAANTQPVGCLFIRNRMVACQAGKRRDASGRQTWKDACTPIGTMRGDA
jgi:hypothetical protein